VVITNNFRKKQISSNKTYFVMNSKNITFFLLRAKFVSDRNDSGYAMLVVSIITIVIFSLLATFAFITQQNTTITNSFVDNANTFYAAESGLNKRADLVRQKFLGYRTPQGLSPGQATSSSVVTPANISNCFTVPVNTVLSATNDFDCQNYNFSYIEATEGGSPLSQNSSSVGAGSSIEDRNKGIDYLSYTFVKDSTNYSVSNFGAPDPIDIPADEPFGGLKALEYKYTVYAGAVKKNSATTNNPFANGSNQSLLQMDFKSRNIPLFQFGVLYERDLESAASLNFALSGRVHTNGNLYVQSTALSFGPAAEINGKTDFLGNVTVYGDVYTTSWASGIDRYGDVRLRNSAGNYSVLPRGVITKTTPLSVNEVKTYSPQLQAGRSSVSLLTLPDAGFLRKRNYKTGEIGRYFSKADVKLQMLPNRAIPFDITSVQSGSGALGSACSTTKPSFGSDPSDNYVDPDRNDVATAKCSSLTAGQLLSLQQPVLTMTNGSSEEEERFCKRSASTTGAVIDRTRDLINYNSITTAPEMDGLAISTQNEILKALQIAVLSSTTPLDYNNVIQQNGQLTGRTLQVYRNLLGEVRNGGSFLSLSVKNVLGSIAPARLAKSRKSCFLSAPIQMVKNSAGVDSFVDRRELFIPGTTIPARKILQTNIESLTVWNRDGRFLDYPDTRSVIPSGFSDAQLVTAFNSTALTTSGMLFKTAVANPSAAIGSFERLGLGASDTTEGGLVFYSTIKDDLNGDGTIDTLTEIAASSANPILKADAAGNNALDSKGQTIVLDYYRKYKNSSNLRHSPYAFALVGGNELPGPLSWVTDQALYLQGDYNNYLLSKKAAAVISDTITTLSVNCISPGTTLDPMQIYTGQINCGIPATFPNLSGISPWSNDPINLDNDPLNYSNPVTQQLVQNNAGIMYRAEDTTYNTAMLQSTTPSRGNYGVGRGGGGAIIEGTPVNKYVRFIENWASKTQTITGSMVSLSIPSESKEAVTIPCNNFGSYCIPPQRRLYSFEANFNDFNKLPPLSPLATYLQQSVYSKQ
jgi:Tfp pilus assembly protein PilX